MADNIIYELGGKPRPHLNRKMRIVLFLNTIIGAGSVVTKDIPANVFAAGNPCRVIKEIHFNKKRA